MVYFGKKMTAEILLGVAEVYIDSCIDEYHKDTHTTAIMLVRLAKEHLQ